MLDGMEELTLHGSYLTPFICFRCKSCFTGFSVIKYTYVAYLKVGFFYENVYLQRSNLLA